MKGRNMKNECWSCENKRPVMGNCHISCIKPDLEMTAHEHGKKEGWFIYPSCFDPVWKTKDCDNYNKIKTA